MPSWQRLSSGFQGFVLVTGLPARSLLPFSSSIEEIRCWDYRGCELSTYDIFFADSFVSAFSRRFVDRQKNSHPGTDRVNIVTGRCDHSLSGNQAVTMACKGMTFPVDDVIQAVIHVGQVLLGVKSLYSIDRSLSRSSYDLKEYGK
jgi:hypothetical protein